ncbi:ATP-binding cassette domain-containing protein [Corallococcus sp. CA049B]|uniref:ATP-binding cassette domain-containing protein n=1 Tax=Corallococcus sp. CA049B TaxID=2316730 RepID=UPI001315ABF4|nr:ATP-binding cassette domain-containing protein [Corallococcus sp. CA049B]
MDEGPPAGADARLPGLRCTLASRTGTPLDVPDGRARGRHPHLLPRGIRRALRGGAHPSAHARRGADLPRGRQRQREDHAAKLLTGLYQPEGGQIVVDGQPITEQTQESYRQLFSAVFSDFYLFERLLGLVGEGTASQVQHYLSLLQLSRKVRIDGGVLSTTELSLGQRKRLALLTAYLEDRPIYLFDEWAADQDPAFKAVFFTELLPELKRKGKTVVVISHDDRYFGVADRVLRLDAGKLVAPAESAPALQERAS